MMLFGWSFDKEENARHCVLAYQDWNQDTATAEYRYNADEEGHEIWFVPRDRLQDGIDAISARAFIVGFAYARNDGTWMHDRAPWTKETGT